MIFLVNVLKSENVRAVIHTVKLMSLNNSFEMNVAIQLVRHGTVCAVVV